jgi:hypothetical protein
VRGLAGQQSGSARRAGGGGAEVLPEEHALLGETLQVRRRNSVAVGLDVTPGIVRVDVEYVRILHGLPSFDESGSKLCIIIRDACGWAVILRRNVTKNMVLSVG